jgi:hypothetical protein
MLPHYVAEYRDRRMGLGLALDIEELLTIEPAETAVLDPRDP